MSMSVAMTMIYDGLPAKSQGQESLFPASKAINPARENKGYCQGGGLFTHLGKNLTVKVGGVWCLIHTLADLGLQAMTEVLRAVFECANIRRAPGQSGELKR